MLCNLEFYLLNVIIFRMRKFIKPFAKLLRSQLPIATRLAAAQSSMEDKSLDFCLKMINLCINC
jgi:hypothetical protein